MSTEGTNGVNAAEPNEGIITENDPDSQVKLLISEGVDERIAQRLGQLFVKNKLSYGDINESVLQSLKKLKILGNEPNGLLEELSDFNDANNKTSKAALLNNLITKYLGNEKCSTDFQNSSSSAGPNLNASSPSSSIKQDQNSSNEHIGPNPEKLKAILDRTGYTLDVTTGQRKYGGPPPDWNGPPPEHGAEVFVGKIPKNMFEDELIPLFEECGRIWDLRLMIDPVTSLNRGYCFITYCNKEDACAAQQKYDGYQIRKGKALIVNISVPNLRLFVGNIPKSKNKDEIYQEFSKLTADLLEVIVYTSPDDRKKNRGFCFLEYVSHKAASLAKRKLSRTKVWACDILVDWADPQEEPDQETMSKVKVLYVRNLTGDVNEEKLKEMFEKFGTLERVKKIKDYAFVHFNDRENAIKAMEEWNEKEVKGSRIEVSLAKPPSDRKKKEEILRNREKRMMMMWQQKALMIGARGPSVMPPVPPPMPSGGGLIASQNRPRNRSATVPTMSPPAYGHRPVPRGYGPWWSAWYAYFSPNTWWPSYESRTYPGNPGCGTSGAIPHCGMYGSNGHERSINGRRSLWEPNSSIVRNIKWKKYQTPGEYAKGCNTKA